MWKWLTTFLLDAIFPTYCCHCGAFGEFLCQDCYEHLHFLSLPVQLRLTDIAIDETWAALAHEPPSTKLIYQLKYNSVQGIGTYLGDLLYETVNIPEADVVTCVPLHPHKQFFRGFNQAEVIAQQLAKNVQLPYLPMLIRTKHTKAQAEGMTKAERLQNTEALYAVHPQLLRYLTNTHQEIPHTVLLVDDVITTGATLHACAVALKKIGVQKVIGLAVTHRG